MLFAGDLAFAGGQPFVLEGSVAGFRRAIAQMRELAPEVLLPGHGPVCRGDEVPRLLDDHGRVRRLSSSRRRRVVRRRPDPARGGAEGTGDNPYADWAETERFVGNLHRAYSELTRQPGRHPAHHPSRVAGHGRLPRRPDRLPRMSGPAEASPQRPTDPRIRRRPGGPRPRWRSRRRACPPAREMPVAAGPAAATVCPACPRRSTGKIGKPPTGPGCARRQRAAATGRSARTSACSASRPRCPTRIRINDVQQVRQPDPASSSAVQDVTAVHQQHVGLEDPGDLRLGVDAGQRRDSTTPRDLRAGRCRRAARHSTMNCLARYRGPEPSGGPTCWSDAGAVESSTAGRAGRPAASRSSDLHGGRREQKLMESSTRSPPELIGERRGHQQRLEAVLAGPVTSFGRPAAPPRRRSRAGRRRRA